MSDIIKSDDSAPHAEILPRKKHQATSPTIQELVDMMAEAFGWNVRGEECLRRMPTFLAAARAAGEITD